MGISSCLGHKRAARLSPSSRRCGSHTIPPRTPCCGRPRRRSKRNGDATKQDEVAVGIGKNTTTVGTVALVAAAKVGVVAPTTAVGMAEAVEAHLAQMVDQDAVIAVEQGSTTGEWWAKLWGPAR